MAETVLNWSALHVLGDDEQQLLAEAAIDVLRQCARDAGEPVSADPTEMPAAVLHHELEAAFSESGVNLPTPPDDLATSQALTLAVLAELGKHPAFRSEVEEAYRQRCDMMVVDFGILTGPALLYLFMKLKRVKLGKEGVDIQFYEYKDEMADGVRKILGGN